MTTTPAPTSRRQECKRGHPLTPENTRYYRGWHRCRICLAASKAECDARARQGNRTMTDEERLARIGLVTKNFWSKVDKRGSGECWPWLGSIFRNGYGQFLARPYRLAHRAAYEIAHGLIPAEMTIDHLCRVRHCVNPDHLEVVTRGENVRRAGAVDAAAAVRRSRTHCRAGHEYTPENTRTRNGQRRCLACGRANSARYNERKRTAK